MNQQTLCLVVLVGCSPKSDDSANDKQPFLEDDLAQIVPSSGLPPEVTVQPSANNLDVIDVDGTIFFAFRTAPSHFASEDTHIYVLRSDDGTTWSHEATFFLGTDLREPRFLETDQGLRLHFARLGTSSVAFEPGGTLISDRGADGEWSDPATLFSDDDTYIPWRSRWSGGAAMLVGYRGGSDTYFSENPEIEIGWYRSDNGRDWSPWAEGAVPVLVGGGSETDLAFADDGAVIAVVRNDAGEDNHWGSKICRGEAEDVAQWTCVYDARKYDSPLVFAHDHRIWLIARRNVTETGAFDLEQRDLDEAEQSILYESTYWGTPKRCSLWEIDPQTLSVSFVLDLPSRGDTCFPSILPLGNDRFQVWNYSSPVDGPDISWLEGQVGETRIYTQTLVIPSSSRP